MDDRKKTKRQLIHELQTARRRIAALEAELAEQRQAAAAARQAQQELRQSADMYERDRKLMAFEIHDGFVQPLTGSLMSLESALCAVGDQCPRTVFEAYKKGLELLRASLDEARRLMARLRPAVLEKLGLVSAIQELAHQTQTAEAVEVEYLHDVQFGRLSPPLENAIFRIVEEALANACRHSRTSKIRISLLQQADRLHLEVEDWGVGFDPGKVPEDRFGLVAIRERACLFGGQAQIHSVPGKGTRISAELPVAVAAPNQPQSETA